MVNAWYFSVSIRSFSAIKNQDAIIPTVMPITVHTSPNPTAIAAPGRASINQADSPEARSENAVTQGPSLRPARR